MNRSIATWLLAGSLAASLSWNWKLSRPAPEPGCGSTCTLDLKALDLDPAQEAELMKICCSACAESDRLEGQANALEAKLRTSLATQDLDEEATRALAAEISTLRQRSLDVCVEGMLELRRLLTSTQIEQLLAQCPPRLGGDSCKIKE